MAKRRDRTDGPIPLADSLSKVVSQISKRDLVGLAAVQQQWDQGIGENVREHASPLRLDGATLVISVDQPTWATQIRLLSGEILETLNAVDGVNIEAVDVVVRRR